MVYDSGYGNEIQFVILASARSLKGLKKEVPWADANFIDKCRVACPIVVFTENWLYS